MNPMVLVCHGLLGCALGDVDAESVADNADGSLLEGRPVLLLGPHTLCGREREWSRRLSGGDGLAASPTHSCFIPPNFHF